MSSGVLTQRGPVPHWGNGLGGMGTALQDSLLQTRHAISMNTIFLFRHILLACLTFSHCPMVHSHPVISRTPPPHPPGICHPPHPAHPAAQCLSYQSNCLAGRISGVPGSCGAQPPGYVKAHRQCKFLVYEESFALYSYFLFRSVTFLAHKARSDTHAPQPVASGAFRGGGLTL